MARIKAQIYRELQGGVPAKGIKAVFEELLALDEEARKIFEKWGRDLILNAIDPAMGLWLVPNIGEHAQVREEQIALLGKFQCPFMIGTETATEGPSTGIFKLVIEPWFAAQKAELEKEGLTDAYRMAVCDILNTALREKPGRWAEGFYRQIYDSSEQFDQMLKTAMEKLTQEPGKEKFKRNVELARKNVAMCRELCGVFEDAMLELLSDYSGLSKELKGLIMREAGAAKYHALHEIANEWLAILQPTKYQQEEPLMAVFMDAKRAYLQTVSAQMNLLEKGDFAHVSLRMLLAEGRQQQVDLLAQRIAPHYREGLFKEQEAAAFFDNIAAVLLGEADSRVKLDIKMEHDGPVVLKLNFVPTPGEFRRLEDLLNSRLEAVINGQGTVTSHYLLCSTKKYPTYIIDASRPDETKGLLPNEEVILMNGKIYLRPGKTRRRESALQVEAAQKFDRAVRVRAPSSRVRVGANQDTPQGIKFAVGENGADFIGLARLENMCDRMVFLTAREFAQKFLAIVDAAKGKPVTLRVVDIPEKTDKVPAPFAFARRQGDLWWKDHPLGRAVTRQIARATQQLLEQRKTAQVKFILPMVNSTEDLDEADGLWSQAIGRAPDRRLGVMVETKGALDDRERLARRAGASSFGTNDWTAALYGIDRLAAESATFYDNIMPRIVWGEAHYARLANEGGVIPSVCGDQAGDKRFWVVRDIFKRRGILIDISVAPALVPLAKTWIDVLERLDPGKVPGLSLVENMVGHIMDSRYEDLGDRANEAFDTALREVVKTVDRALGEELRALDTTPPFVPDHGPSNDGKVRDLGTLVVMTVGLGSLSGFYGLTALAVFVLSAVFMAMGHWRNQETAQQKVEKELRRGLGKIMELFERAHGTSAQNKNADHVLIRKLRAGVIRHNIDNPYRVKKGTAVTILINGDTIIDALPQRLRPRNYPMQKPWAVVFTYFDHPIRRWAHFESMVSLYGRGEPGRERSNQSTGPVDYVADKKATNHLRWFSIAVVAAFLGVVTAHAWAVGVAVLGVGVAMTVILVPLIWALHHKDNQRHIRLLSDGLLETVALAHGMSDASNALVPFDGAFARIVGGIGASRRAILREWARSLTLVDVLGQSYIPYYGMRLDSEDMERVEDTARATARDVNIILPGPVTLGHSVSGGGLPMQEWHLKGLSVYKLFRMLVRLPFVQKNFFQGVVISRETNEPFVGLAIHGLNNRIGMDIVRSLSLDESAAGVELVGIIGRREGYSNRRFQQIYATQGGLPNAVMRQIFKNITNQSSAFLNHVRLPEGVVRKEFVPGGSTDALARAQVIILAGRINSFTEEDALALIVLAPAVNGGRPGAIIIEATPYAASDEARKTLADSGRLLINASTANIGELTAMAMEYQYRLRAEKFKPHHGEYVKTEITGRVIANAYRQMRNLQDIPEDQPRQYLEMVARENINYIQRFDALLDWLFDQTERMDRLSSVLRQEELHRLSLRFERETGTGNDHQEAARRFIGLVRRQTRRVPDQSRDLNYTYLLRQTVFEQISGRWVSPEEIERCVPLLSDKSAQNKMGRVAAVFLIAERIYKDQKERGVVQGLLAEALKDEYYAVNMQAARAMVVHGHEGAPGDLIDALGTQMDSRVREMIMYALIHGNFKINWPEQIYKARERLGTARAGLKDQYKRRRKFKEDPEKTAAVQAEIYEAAQQVANASFFLGSLYRVRARGGVGGAAALAVHFYHQTSRYFRLATGEAGRRALEFNIKIADLWHEIGEERGSWDALIENDRKAVAALLDVFSVAGSSYLIFSGSKPYAQVTAKGLEFIRSQNPRTAFKKLLMIYGFEATAAEDFAYAVTEFLRRKPPTQDGTRDFWMRKETHWAGLRRGVSELMGEFSLSEVGRAVNKHEIWSQNSVWMKLILLTGSYLFVPVELKLNARAPYEGFNEQVAALEALVRKMIVAKKVPDLNKQGLSPEALDFVKWLLKETGVLKAGRRGQWAAFRGKLTKEEKEKLEVFKADAGSRRLLDPRTVASAIDLVVPALPRDMLAPKKVFYIETSGRSPPNATFVNDDIVVFAGPQVKIIPSLLARILIHEIIESYWVQHHPSVRMERRHELARQAEAWQGIAAEGASDIIQMFELRDKRPVTGPLTRRHLPPFIVQQRLKAKDLYAAYFDMLTMFDGIFEHPFEAESRALENYWHSFGWEHLTPLAIQLREIRECQDKVRLLGARYQIWEQSRTTAELFLRKQQLYNRVGLPTAGSMPVQAQDVRAVFEVLQDLPIRDSAQFIVLQGLVDDLLNTSWSGEICDGPAWFFDQLRFAKIPVAAMHDSRRVYVDPRLKTRQRTKDILYYRAAMAGQRLSVLGYPKEACLATQGGIYVHMKERENYEAYKTYVSQQQELDAQVRPKLRLFRQWVWARHVRRHFSRRSRELMIIKDYRRLHQGSVQLIRMSGLLEQITDVRGRLDRTLLVQLTGRASKQNRRDLRSLRQEEEKLHERVLYFLGTGPDRRALIPRFFALIWRKLQDGTDLAATRDRKILTPQQEQILRETFREQEEHVRNFSKPLFIRYINETAVRLLALQWITTDHLAYSLKKRGGKKDIRTMNGFFDDLKIMGADLWAMHYQDRLSRREKMLVHEDLVNARDKQKLYGVLTHEEGAIRRFPHDFNLILQGIVEFGLAGVTGQERIKIKQMGQNGLNRPQKLLLVRLRAWQEDMQRSPGNHRYGLIFVDSQIKSLLKGAGRGVLGMTAENYRDTIPNSLQGGFNVGVMAVVGLIGAALFAFMSLAASTARATGLFAAPVGVQTTAQSMPWMMLLAVVLAGGLMLGARRVAAGTAHNNDRQYYTKKRNGQHEQTCACRTAHNVPLSSVNNIIEVEYNITKEKNPIRNIPFSNVPATTCPKINVTAARFPRLNRALLSSLRWIELNVIEKVSMIKDLLRILTGGVDVVKRSMGNASLTTMTINISIDYGPMAAAEAIATLALDKAQVIGYRKGNQHSIYTVIARAEIPGHQFLSRELFDTDRPGRSGKYDLLFNAQGHLLAIFPVFGFSILRRHKFLDFSPFYVAVPRLDSPGASEKWDAFYKEYLSNQKLIEGYQKRFSIWGNSYVEVVNGPYEYVEINKVTGEWEGRELNVARAQPYFDMKSHSVHRALIPVFPSVYAQTSITSAKDRTYYSSLWADTPAPVGLREGGRVVLVGPGSGPDAWVLALKTKTAIRVFGKNPMEVANVRATARLLGFSVRAEVADNIIDDRGHLRFDPLDYDLIVWNMPNYAPDSGYYVRKKSVGFESIWDGEHGEVLTRFAMGVKHAARRNPAIRAFIWNSGFRQVGEVFGRNGLYTQRYLLDRSNLAVYLIGRRAAQENYRDTIPNSFQGGFNVGVMAVAGVIGAAGVGIITLTLKGMPVQNGWGAVLVVLAAVGLMLGAGGIAARVANGDKKRKQSKNEQKDHIGHRRAHSHLLSLSRIIAQAKNNKKDNSPITNNQTSGRPVTVWPNIMNGYIETVLWRFLTGGVDVVKRSMGNASLTATAINISIFGRFVKWTVAADPARTKNKMTPEELADLNARMEAYIKEHKQEVLLQPPAHAQEKARVIALLSSRKENQADARALADAKVINAPPSLLAVILDSKASRNSNTVFSVLLTIGGINYIVPIADIEASLMYEAVNSRLRAQGAGYDEIWEAYCLLGKDITIALEDHSARHDAFDAMGTQLLVGICSAGLALSAAVLALSGCATAPEKPSAPDSAELQRDFDAASSQAEHFSREKTDDPKVLEDMAGILKRWIGPATVQTRVYALRALALSGDKTKGEVIVKFALNNPEADLRREAVKALGGLGDRSVADDIVKRLSDKDPWVVAEAARVLWDWKHAGVVKLLTDAWEAAQGKEGFWPARSLIEDILRKAAGDSDNSMSGPAKEWLKNHGDTIPNSPRAGSAVGVMAVAGVIGAAGVGITTLTLKGMPVQNGWGAVLVVLAAVGLMLGARRVAVAAAHHNKGPDRSDYSNSQISPSNTVHIIPPSFLSRITASAYRSTLQLIPRIIIAGSKAPATIWLKINEAAAMLPKLKSTLLKINEAAAMLPKLKSTLLSSLRWISGNSKF
ncbi:MAG: HEAT repeat domain-containing protein [Candidatus Omnitrophica bacterium]|nr:HEAT repeat domain-containing protein [Candidatus Omnitrophota bacterium]